MDERGSPSSMLLIAGVVMTEWLLIVAELTGQLQYYFWAFVVVVAWSEAWHTRNPGLYKQRSFRIFFFSLAYIGFFVFNKMIIYIQQNGLRIPQAALDLAAWLQFFG